MAALVDAAGGHADAVLDGDLDAARALLSDATVTVVLGRPSVAESPAAMVEAAAVLLDAKPDARFLVALRRANVRGALDLGLAPGMLPGRVSLDDGRDVVRRTLAGVPTERGLDAAGILAAAAEGRIDVLVLLGSDPITDFPDRALAARALAGARTVIAVDTFVNDSAQQADVVLAVAGYAEVDGTTTNIEGRISSLTQKVTPPGTSRPDWMLAAELAYRLEADLGLESVDGIWDEIERVAPAHAGITRRLLDLPPAPTVCWRRFGRTWRPQLKAHTCRSPECRARSRTRRSWRGPRSRHDSGSEPTGAQSPSETVERVRGHLSLWTRTRCDWSPAANSTTTARSSSTRPPWLASRRAAGFSSTRSTSNGSA